jgi:hypothetical protein
LSDHRKKGPNTHYSIQDAALGAFGIFFTQSRSFLDNQRHLQQAKGHNNACTLFGVTKIPCTDQIRNLLDPMMPNQLDGVDLEVFEGLEQHGLLGSLRVLTDQLLVLSMAPSTIPPTRCIAKTVSGVKPHRAAPFTLIAPLPQWSFAQDAQR